MSTVPNASEVLQALRQAGLVPVTCIINNGGNNQNAVSPTNSASIQDNNIVGSAADGGPAAAASDPLLSGRQLPFGPEVPPAKRPTPPPPQPVDANHKRIEDALADAISRFMGRGTTFLRH
ncbi:hypothetical protein BKA70DRAFT_1401164 [Coprinopsis sp. MPI-PUGE-AT-0042]|nr:hypothetical protein BKA70DRAFT_1401164 [Coprinopsis sp. MPI-PUGE-AT-0042]